MTATDWAAATRRAARNAALVQAELIRHDATYEAQVEYSETVAKLRERYEGDVLAASELLRAATRPAYQAYNAAVVAAERSIRQPV